MRKAIIAKENAKNGGCEVVFLGDSLMDGCDLAKYDAGYFARNRGISVGSDTADDVKAWLKRLGY